MQGVDYATNELANRSFRDGETKNDSAPAPPMPSAAAAVVAPSPPSPATPPPSPQMKVPDQPQIAKKEESPAETMMRELDAALAQKDKPTDAPETSPLMRSPEERSSPRAIPVAAPVVTTPRTEKDAFQPETHRAATKGTISNASNEDSVNAAGTPTGRYVRQVTSAIEKKWHQYRIARLDAVEPGKMGLRFYVNKNGKIEDLQFTFKESNPLMEDFTIEAILKAEIPPIPKDLLPILEKERIPIEYDIVIH
jgi:outer membrane biosynthesis protein TonB